MKKLILPALCLSLLAVTVIAGAEPSSSHAPLLSASTQLTTLQSVEAQPLEWPLRPAFLVAGFGGSSCVECQTHAECVSVCGVPWASCTHWFGTTCAASGDQRFCSYN